MVAELQGDPAGDGQPPPHDGLMGRVRGGDREARDQLIALVEAELRRRAHSKLRREGPGISIRTTALINEAVMRILKQGAERLQDPAHFRNAVLLAMTHVLVDRAKRKKLAVDPDADADDVLLDRTIRHLEVSRRIHFEDFIEKLEKFAEDHPELARIVKMKVFLEMKAREIAAELGCDSRTVERKWRTARLLLGGRLQ